MSTAILDGEATIRPEPAGEPEPGRQRILREGRRLFAERGYAAVSMQQIADAAVVNKATLYHHVRDKEDLFLAVMAEELTRSRADLAAVLAEGGTLREQLRRVATSLFATHRPDVSRLMTDLRHHVSPERRQELFAACVPPWTDLAPVVTAAMAAGEVRPVDPEVVARLFFAMAISQHWWADPGAALPSPDPALAETIVEVLFAGIATDPE